jgi:hypothetical protein
VARIQWAKMCTSSAKRKALASRTRARASRRDRARPWRWCLGRLHLLFQRIALGNGSIGTPFQGGAQTGELLQAVKHIPVASHPGPGQRLACAQAAPAVGDGVVRAQALRGEIQEVNPPGLGVAVGFGRKPNNSRLI